MLVLDLGSHKPVRGGKRRVESTPFALVIDKQSLHGSRW